MILFTADPGATAAVNAAASKVTDTIMTMAPTLIALAAIVCALSIGWRFAMRSMRGGFGGGGGGGGWGGVGVFEFLDEDGEEIDYDPGESGWMDE